MIRGFIREEAGRRRPFLSVLLGIPSLRLIKELAFLVDTGADGTLLAPRDAAAMGIEVHRLPDGPASTGVGGRVPTVYAPATLTIDTFTYDLSLRVLAPRSRSQQRDLARVPSLLGRDILAHFALFFEERTSRVLLLTPPEAAALSLP